MQLCIVFAALITCLSAIVDERRRATQEAVESQVRVVQAADRERRKLERDLPDGAQQRLMALQIKLRMAQDHADTGRRTGGFNQIG